MSPPTGPSSPTGWAPATASACCSPPPPPATPPPPPSPSFNEHVQNAAAAGHVAIQAYSSLFTVVGSTADTDARDNTRTTYTEVDLGLPIYWLNGDKVADQYKDFYNGDWDEEANATDESGSTRSLSANADWPFTGSSDDGTAASLTELGSTANLVRVGRPNSLTADANPLSSSGGQLNTGSRPFYALSPIFIVGQKITVPSNWALVPAGLGIGGRFRLLFASSHSNNANDTGIADYNSWVQARAAAGHAGIRAYSSFFRVLASTAAADARDNTETTYSDDDKGVPIHWLGGTQVADEYEDFYDGDWDDEANATDESGSARSLSAVGERPYTGSDHDGTEAFTGTSSRALGAAQVRIGRPNSSGSGDGPLSTTSGDVPKTTIRPFYALSAVLEVSPHGVANNAPAFTATPPVTRDLAENTAAGENVGAPVAASDDDTTDTLTYSLRGTDAASFEIVTTSGQIQTKAEVGYDHETTPSYSVQVRVTDGIASATIAVTITVTDVDEPPAAPAARAVAVLPTAGTQDSLDVSWTAPDNTGKPAITDYDVQYRAVGAGTWTDLNHTGTALSATISGLDVGTAYQVRVRATNAEGTGAWSDPGQAPTRRPPTEVPAHWGLVPTGLGSGDSFRLLFLSSTKRDATSTDISDYNAFVRIAAAAGHADIQAYSAGFAAVGSTAATDARVNTASTYTDDDQGLPIHWLGGTRVADDYADFYDGSWDDEENPTNESGSAEPPVNDVGNREGIFTGTQDDGTASSSDYLGTTERSTMDPTMSDFATVGLLDENVGDPLDGGSLNAALKGDSRRFYALSPVFVVASEVPVPSDWSLVPDGLGPGDTFRLLFATSTTRDATSTAIADYNTFVQTAAGHADIQAYSALFRAVGSTAADDARDNTSTTHTNTDTGVLIHWLGGNQVADDYADFYDLSWDDEANATDESGDARSLSGASRPFTGSNNNGTADSSNPLGANRAGYGTLNSAIAGRNPLKTTGQSFSNTDTRPFYALSPVFAVTSEVTVPSNWSLKPTGLTTGNRFRLLFATSTTRDATSTDIADYNSFVQTAAAAGHADIQAYSASFRVVGSTADDHARDNTSTTYTSFDTGLPIHWLGGSKAADDYEDFYDGDWDDEANAKDQSGSARSLSMTAERPFTGSNHNGTATSSTTLGTGQVRIGEPNSSSAGHGPLSGNRVQFGTTTHPLYALSPVFAVGSEGVATNSAPVFSSATATRSVAENSAADSNVGAVVPAATDTDVGDTLTYSMEGADAASFTFDAATRQIKTKDGVTYDFEADSSYSVTIKVSDGTDTDTVAVTITLTDVDEPPAAPDAPTVSATAGTSDSLDVTWTAPANAGKPAIDNYDLQYRVGTSGSFTAGPQNQTGLTARVGSLTAGTSYEVQVRAHNDEGDGPWSASGTGSTSTPTNSAPVFSPNTATRSIAENTAADTNVGAVIHAATDTDASDTLTYSMEGADAASFTFDAATRQIKTKDGVTYDFEADSSYSVTIKVSDGTDTDTVAVTVSLTDVAEPPDAPDAPTVSATAGMTDSLDVSWTAPDNAGRPAITDYDVQYSVAGSGTWIDAGHTGTGLSATITGLAAGTAYEVQVRATNDEGTGAWSDSGTGTTGSPPTEVPLDWDLLPDGLDPGDSFRLLFATSTTRDATSLAIADYNTFVQDAAAAGHAAIQDYSAAFRAVGSTRATDARDNTETTYTDDDKGVPIHWLGGSQVADDYEDFYDGSWDDEANAKDESGSARAISSGLDRPYTGSNHDGTEFIDGDSFALGQTGSGVVIARPSNSDAAAGPLSSDLDESNVSTARPFYALSEVFTVGSEVTVPSNWSLNPTGLTTGNRFRLLFATSTTRNGSSANIGVYNTFVQTAAAAGHADIQAYSSLFTVVASTADTDARDNTFTTYTDDDKGVPIHWLGGSQVADDYEDFYDGSWDDEANPKDESGSARSLSATAEQPFTGSNNDGTESSTRTLGESLIRVGQPGSTVSGRGPIDGNASRAGTPSRPFYALSPVFAIGSEVVATNSAPTFANATEARSVAENSAGSTNVGAVVTASDADNDPLAYTLEGTDAASFSIVSTSGQIQTESGVTYDHEAKSTYAVTVKADDSRGGSDTVAVTITVTDVAEQPATPTAPSVTATAGSTTSLDVSWTAPGLNGGPALTGYEVQYRKVPATVWTDRSHSGTGTTATITPLDASSAYQVRVRALNGETPSGWSPHGSGTTGTPNAPPVFANDTEARSVAENTAAAENVGAVVTATDTNVGDTLTYSLEGTDAASFDIEGTSGQIKTKSALDHETRDSYAVTVKADDGNGGSDTVAVTITVTDVAEPPDAPDAPTVSATAGTTDSLDVSWTAPDNAGRPAITDYDVQYQAVGSGTWLDAGHTGTALSATLANLAAGTVHAVQVRATNDEGTGAWSDSGLASTDSPSTEVPANWALIPTGLTTSDTFRLLFLTATSHDPDSSDIAVYNTYVQVQAAAGHADIQAYSAGFRVVGSTASVDARDNTATTGAGVPIHWLDGTKVADDYADFYDGSWDDEANPSARGGDMISPDRVWTGSGSDGTEKFTSGNLSRAFGATGNLVGTGRLDHSSAGPLDSDESFSPNTNYRYYALSSVFAVGSEVVNSAPEFANDAEARSVAENTAAAENVGAVVTATDTNVGDTLTYSLEGTDAASFDIEGTSGQIKTKSALDHETKGSYAVTVKADDGNGGSDTVAVTITVTDVAEQPLTPTAPSVTATSGSTTSLDVGWTAPGLNGGPALIGYEVQYRKVPATVWTDRSHSGTGTSTTISGLDASSEYQVQVRALNGETPSGWSPHGSGTTGTPNAPPVFANDAEARSVAENTAAAENVGAVVTATDTNVGDTLTYSLEGTDAASFDIEGTSGQIKTKSALDHETKGSYAVTVKADDGNGGSDTVAVTITVTDVAEQPATPTAPSVTATSGSTTSLDVSWTAPGLNGGPALTGYEVQYRKVPATVWTAWTGTVTGTSTTITGLDASSEYQVQVRALNGETPSGWSPAGSGTTATPNSAPEFANATEARSVAENSAADSNVGAVVPAATDTDVGDTLTYSMEGADAASFTFDAATRQIKTKDGVTYDFEADSSYSVTIKVSDGTDTDTVAVTVSLTDVDEPPDAPDAPTVSATSGSTTSLDATWTAPANAGKPAITDYDVRYGVDGSGTWIDAGHTGTGLSATLAGLAAGTAYEVQVRATNDEGTGAWSASGTGTTGSPSTEVPADWSLIPTGLTSGDSFRLLFIPSTGTDAGSDDIADYNGFVQTAAAAGHADIQAHSAGFRMVGSTEAVDARDNTATTGTGVPIHWLNGARVADDYADFHDGDWDEEATGRRGTGATVTLGSGWELWTGSAQDGTALTAVDTTSRALGNAGNNWVGVGRPNNGSHGPMAGTTAVRTESKGVYALSGVFTVGAPVVVANSAPAFTDTAPAARSVAENTAAGQDVGAAVAAIDVNTADTLTYSLGGTDAASFDIVSASGQIRTKAALDHETKSSHAVDVSVTDGTETVSLAVAITVTDVAEQPATPTAPTVAATAGSSTSLDVGWTAPGLNGGPALTGYKLRHRQGAGSWTEVDAAATSTAATIGSLDAGGSYDVQVRALNGETPSDWSPSGTGSTAAAVVNAAPVFADSAPAARSVAENTAAGQDVGAAVAATDTDTGDTLTYSLGGTDAGSFSIVTASGQIRTKTGVTYDHETKSSHAVAVGVTDGTDTVSLAVTIAITDVAEKPATPAAPSVGATAGTTDSLDVAWTAPGLNGGPALTDYGLRYRAGGGSWTSAPHSGTGTTATIGSLTANTAYQVQVRALNGETPSDWSPSGSGTTGVPALPALSVADASASEGAGTMVFAVTLSPAGTEQVTVAYATSGGTATQGTDYTAASGTLTFAPGDTAETITVTLTDDALAEGDETFAVTLSAAQNATLGNATATGTITDNDQPSTAVVLSLDPDTVGERDGARTVTATAALDGAARATATAVAVGWTTAGTATAGVDYRTPSAFTVTIPANATSATATFTFTPVDDTVEEGDETVVLRASATDLADGTATLTIGDDDQASVAVLLGVSPSSVSESGGARSVRVTATLDASARAAATDVVVSLHSQDAEFGPGRDAAVVAPFTITLEPGRTGASRSFTLRPHDDALAEGTETIEIRGQATGLRVEPATLALTDDDTATVNLAVPYKSRHSEGGGAAHVTVEATLDTMRSAATVVTVQVRGSGRAGVSGFAAVAPFELTIPAGARRNVEGGFMLYPENDDQAEADETLTIGGRAAGLRVTGTTFLLEDDDSGTASTTVTLELNETRLAESGGAHVDLTVTGTLDGAPREQDTVVTLTPTNRKGDGSEVTALVDTGMRLTIRAGRISGRRTFGIVLDTPGIDQADGMLTLGGTADGLTVEPATLELLDGDAPPDRITLTLSETRVPEGWSGTVRVLAEMTPSARTGETVVTLTVTGTDAAGAVNFEPVRDFKLTIPKAWEAYGAKFVLVTEEDAASGRDETLTVRGTTDVAGLQVRSATLTLVASDAPQAVRFAFFANGGSIASRNGGLTSANAGVVTSANGDVITAVDRDVITSVNGASITSELVLLNLAPHPVRPEIHFSDPAGDRIAPATVVDATRDLRITDDGSLTVSTPMEPLAMLTVSTHGRGPLVSGSVTVRSAGPIGAILRYRVPELGVAAMAGGEPVRDALLPARSRAGGMRTAVALHNPGAEAITVGCKLIGGGGITLAEREISLPANGQTSWFIEDGFGTTETADFLGSVRCTAPGDGLFTAVALQIDAGNRIFAALPVVPVDRAGGGGDATELGFAQFANGAGIASELLFVNPSTRPGGSLPTAFDSPIPTSRPTIYFHDTQGNPIAPASVVELSGDLRITDDGGLTPSTDMAPLGVRTISTHGHGELLSGSVRVVSDGPLGAFLRVGLPAAGVSVVGANPPLNEAIFLARHQEGGVNTRVAIHNLESTTAVVRCDLVRQGTLLDIASFLLTANGQMSGTVDGMFPAADAPDFAGSMVRCVGTGRFTATALEMDPRTGTFTTLPALKVEERRTR